MEVTKQWLSNNVFFNTLIMFYVVMADKPHGIQTIYVTFLNKQCIECSSAIIVLSLSFGSIYALSALDSLAPTTYLRYSFCFLSNLMKYILKVLRNPK